MMGLLKHFNGLGMNGLCLPTIQNMSGDSKQTQMYFARERLLATNGRTFWAEMVWSVNLTASSVQSFTSGCRREVWFEAPSRECAEDSPWTTSYVTFDATGTAYIYRDKTVPTTSQPLRDVTPV